MKVEHFRAISNEERNVMVNDANPDNRIKEFTIPFPADMPGAYVWFDRDSKPYWRCTKTI